MAASREQLERLCNVDPIEAIPSAVYLPVLTCPPFVPLFSLLNLRDAGSVPGSRLPPARFYRCGTLEAVHKDPDAVAWLGANVKRIFDLRTPEERLKAPDPEVEGVENVWLDGDGIYTDPHVMDFVEDNGRKAWKAQFMAVANVYRPIFRAVLEHVRDRPKEPILFHCTAGRDRTGVLAGLLQTLAGSPHDAVILDYKLSRIGSEPAREHLVRFALKGSGAESIETPGFREMIALEQENFEALEEGLRERYGGWEGYVVAEDGLAMSREDLETVKRNLTA